ncbi:MAG: BREX system ATP-binding protein BrxD [Bradymonadia bacterium]
MSLSEREITHIFEKLRSGLVPERGLDAFAEGIEKPRGELHRQLDMAADGEGCIKFIRGGYGCGKTFMARLATLDAQSQGFATSFVVVSDNDLRFHRFDEVYGRVVAELATDECQRGALDAMLDRWIGAIEDRLVAAGADDESDDFDEHVRAELKRDLLSLTGGQIPRDFVRVVQTYFDMKQKGDYATAGALLSWLGGSTNVAASAKKHADIKGDITSSDAMEYLRGVVEITRAAGYKGLLVVIDEAETIIRMRSDTRHKSLNGIRQIADGVGSYEGLVWLFTGTPEFFDSRKGVKGLQPLHDRIGFMERNGFASLRQPQLALQPFKAERLQAVAIKLRDLYPSAHRDRVEVHITDSFISKMVSEITTGLRGDVGIIPRIFLREFVEQLDLVDEHDDYSPAEHYGFELDESRLTPEELARHDEHNDAQAALDEDEPSVIPVEDVW